MKRTQLKFIAAIALMPLLGGCVAALIPVAAGGAIFGKEESAKGGTTSGEKAAKLNVIVEAPSTSEATAEPVVARAPIAPVKTADVAELPASIEPTTPIAPPALQRAEPAPNFEQAFAPLPAASAKLAPSAKAPVPLVIPPPLASAQTLAQAVTQTTPKMATTSAATSRPNYGPTDFRAYDALYSYVDSQARRDPVQSARQSALLAAPGSLSPMRTDCSIRPPAVLIDLDPGNAPFDPAIEAQPNPALSQLLASLRAQEVEIFWISELSAIQAGAVRKALVGSGMDPAGRDGLLLMRRVEDRKQARRKELAETHCLLAIAGDNRTDFDELYLYLKDTNAAQPLEALIGAGWFITPLPISALNQNPEG